MPVMPTINSGLLVGCLVVAWILADGGMIWAFVISIDAVTGLLALFRAISVVVRMLVLIEFVVGACKVDMTTVEKSDEASANVFLVMLAIAVVVVDKTKGMVCNAVVLSIKEVLNGLLVCSV